MQQIDNLKETDKMENTSKKPQIYMLLMLLMLCAATIRAETSVTSDPAESADDLSLFRDGMTFVYYDDIYEGAMEFKFNGTTEENGHIYHNLIWTRDGRALWNDEQGCRVGIWWDDVIECPPLPLRDDDGKVVFLVPEDWRDDWIWDSPENYFNPPYNAPPDTEFFDIKENGWEIPICDYNCKTGDRYYTVNNYYLTEVEVIGTGKVEVEGRERKSIYAQWWYDSSLPMEENIPSAVEGIGLTIGTPVSVCFRMMVRDRSYAPEADTIYVREWFDLPCWGGPKLYGVWDEDGNVQYGQYLPDGDLSTVDELLSDQSMQSEEAYMYDLFGREVSSPQPGGVYIRDGKKFVCPR